MCLIVFDWRPDAVNGALLTAVANRDEFFARRTAPAGWWPDAPDVLAGRDLQAGGTWLALARDGRFAALTNYRAPQLHRADAPTRGLLVADYVTGPHRAPLDYLAAVAAEGARYNGFNLLAGDLAARQLAYYGNRAPDGPRLLDAGLYGLSNALLDTPWPKVLRAKAALRDALAAAGGRPAPDALLALLRDPAVAPDAELPSTGLPLDRERALSAAFIDAGDYGTRSTTVLSADADGRVDFVEVGYR